MNEITLEDLRQIMARCNAATAGPWESWIEGRDHTSGSDFIRTAGDDIELIGAATDADQDFIASSRQDVPRLIHEILRLKGWSL
jgi:hypothetical protein